ncbi:hypothetical protein [uncultured Aquimarina sp.]|nr:hypothetical protein [uncultured Aquimarina sp.]
MDNHILFDTLLFDGDSGSSKKAANSICCLFSYINSGNAYVGRYRGAM